MARAADPAAKLAANPAATTGETLAANFRALRLSTLFFLPRAPFPNCPAPRHPHRPRSQRLSPSPTDLPLLPALRAQGIISSIGLIPMSFVFPSLFWVVSQRPGGFVLAFNLLIILSCTAVAALSLVGSVRNIIVNLSH